MGNKHSGNPTAHGMIGNAGGTGRPPLPADDKKSISVRLSPRLWYKLQLATLRAGLDDWRVWIEQVCDTEDVYIIHGSEKDLWHKFLTWQIQQTQEDA